VLGPYEQEKLQALARRGQLSRMHEISTDGVSWVRASNFPELFTGGQNELSVMESEPKAGFGNDAGAPYRSSSPTAPPTMPGGAQAKWYYTSGGQQQGPADFSDLQILAGLGQLEAQDQVWADGMAAWMPAGQVQGLMKHSATSEGATSVSIQDAASSLPESLCRTARDARSWAIFIAVIMYLYSFANVVFGILALIVGARERSASSVTNGVIALINALVIIVGGTLLSTYASRLGSLRYTKEPIILERALDALRNFWIFVGMYLVVVLALIVIGAIAVFAYGVTLPQL
jgi:hypothetical protein